MDMKTKKIFIRIAVSLLLLLAVFYLKPLLHFVLWITIAVCIVRWALRVVLRFLPLAVVILSIWILSTHL